jgi:hypothetical protein
MSKLTIPVWINDMGAKVSCVEKIKVMNQNIYELEQILQDTYDDAILMGVSRLQIRQFFHHMIDKLKDNYK